MFVKSQPPSIAMTVRDMDALRSLMRTPNLQSEVAEFVAHLLQVILPVRFIVL